MRVILALIAALAMILRPEDVPPAFAPWAPLDLKAAPNFVTPLKLARMDGACPSILTAGGVIARPVPDRTVSEVCHIRDAVQPTRFSAARMAAETMRCDIAIRLALWERHDLQPAAQRLLGTKVAEIRHLGAYSCRPIRTAQGGAGRMSEHSSANAFDIAGFELSDGRVVDLAQDWGGTGPKAAFLRAARDGLCARFRVVLSPDYNALHADHFHVDQGPFMSCR